MANKLIYIPNDGRQNYPFCRLKLGIEKIKHSTSLTNQFKINYSPQSFLANEYENVIIKLWGLL